MKKSWKVYPEVLTDSNPDLKSFHKNSKIKFKTNVRNFKKQEVFITLKIIKILDHIVIKKKEFYNKEIRDIKKSCNLIEENMVETISTKNDYKYLGIFMEKILFKNKNNLLLTLKKPNQILISNEELLYTKL